MKSLADIREIRDNITDSVLQKNVCPFWSIELGQACALTRMDTRTFAIQRQIIYTGS